MLRIVQAISVLIQCLLPILTPYPIFPQTPSHFMNTTFRLDSTSGVLGAQEEDAKESRQACVFRSVTFPTPFETFLSSLLHLTIRPRPTHIASILALDHAKDLITIFVLDFDRYQAVPRVEGFVASNVLSRSRKPPWIQDAILLEFTRDVHRILRSEIQIRLPEDWVSSPPATRLSTDIPAVLFASYLPSTFVTILLNLYSNFAHSIHVVAKGSELQLGPALHDAITRRQIS
ncbi:hypothetical protein BD779DRAFT_1675252 [Infundibulicybe gibba]|nr:hypothetical protein BD779DRAFT_1675252 [Infundibulicybe gibba]